MRADERNNLLLGEVLLLFNADVLVLLEVTKVSCGYDYVFVIIGKAVLELGFMIVPCCGRCCWGVRAFIVHGVRGVPARCGLLVL